MNSLHRNFSIAAIVFSLISILLNAQELIPPPAPAVPVTLAPAEPLPEPDKVLAFPPLSREIVEVLRTMLLEAEVSPGVPLLGFDESSSGLQHNQITRLLLFLNDQGTYTLSIAVKAQPDSTPTPEPTP